VPIVANNTVDKTKVQQLQNKLYRAAKSSRSRRFHALYDKLWRIDVLERAWFEVAKNGGAPGVDGVTIEAIEEAGVGQFLARLADSIKDGTYRPKPVRRVRIPKPDGGERLLGVPCVADRCVQAAAKLLLEPIFEADFASCSYGFRPKRSAHQALDAIRAAVKEGRRWVAEADIKTFLDSSSHCPRSDCRLWRKTVSGGKPWYIRRFGLGSAGRRLAAGCGLHIATPPVEGVAQAALRRTTAEKAIKGT
jgi:retron-type reverse transcriptase